MKFSILLFFAFLTYSNLFSFPVINYNLSYIRNNVDSSKKSENPVLYIDADKMPKFNYEGGFKKYYYSNLKWPMNGQLDAYGIVLVSFVINKNGNVEDIKIENSLCSESDKEAIRVFENMPKWEPGEKDSKLIDVKMYFPVEFIIRSKSEYDSLSRAESPVLYIMADKLPKFNYEGGLNNYFSSQLPNNLRMYSSTILVSFVINKMGKVKDIRILNGFNDEYINMDVYHAFLTMPSWEPGEKDSNPVDVKMYYPVEVKINIK
jgi:TonB family protein